MVQQARLGVQQELKGLTAMSLLQNAHVIVCTRTQE
jgi:hypothetical protein